jgi:hypothetical protein
MNEKFKQLALEAKMATADFDAGSYYVATPDRMQLFAESIVRECADQLIKWKNEPFPYDPEFGARLIKQHFGVEQ